MDRFRPDPAGRAESRRQMNAGDRLVLVYAGSLGSWYRIEEMAELFARVRKRRPALFVVYTRSDGERVRRALERRQLPASDLFVKAVPPLEMPRYLSAADAAVSFIRPSFSKLASSPTKLAEYLAMGLPVVMNRGVGDSDQVTASSEAIVDAGELTSEEIDHAAEKLLTLPGPATAAAARRTAQSCFSLSEVGIPAYLRMYERLVAR
jgi:glycosyltransferase involved in cell wall biosynthesis